MSIYVWWPRTDYSMAKWPCSTGFHVPTFDELGTVRNILVSTFWLAQNSTTAATYLKMPLAWQRYTSNWNTNLMGSRWEYHTVSTSWTYVSWLMITSSVFSEGSFDRASGGSIRPFKDTAVVPDSNWTTLYNWSSVASGAWVFRNSSLWLISISGNGTTRYTMADKNLWATSTNTNNTSSYWNHYQWGNNYGFPSNSSVSTSSTLVDASNYWPWNYYSNSTFRTTSSSPYDRSSVQNDNLRWWKSISTTWEIKNIYVWTTAAKAVYVGTTKVRPTGWWSYTPTANTIMYFPLTSDAVDLIHWVTLTAQNTTPTWTSPSGTSVPCAYFSSAWYFAKTTSTSYLVTWNAARTISWWIRFTWTSRTSVACYWTWSSNQMFTLYYNDWTPRWRFTQWGSWSSYGSTPSMNTWYNVVVTFDGSYVRWYINWNLDVTWSKSLNTSNARMYIAWDMSQTWSAVPSTWLQGYVSEVIFENIAWSQTQVTNYFNSVKSNYWL